MHGLDYFVHLSCVFFYYLHLSSVSTMFMVNKASCESRQLELNQKHRQILESKGDMSPGAKSRYLHALPIS